MEQQPAAEPGPAGLEFEHYAVGTAIVLTVRGDIDTFTAPDLTGAILDAARDRPASVVVDLTQVDFLGSAGMTALVTSQRTLAPATRQLVVADGPGTSRPLKLVGLDGELGLHATLDDALAAG